jgi:hypothetical protein
MMRFEAPQRPIDKKARWLRGKRSYALAAMWLKLVRAMRKWKNVERLAGWLNRIAGELVSRRWARLLVRREKVWSEIFYRFSSVFRDVLVASGCADAKVASELTVCCVRLHDIVNSDPRNKCLPEMMWQACVLSRNIDADAKLRLQARFHLRALLDEVRPDDERAAVRFFVFSTPEEREERRTLGTNIRDAYGAEERIAVETGLQNFAEYLYKKRSKVETLTNGAITSRGLTTLEDAFSFIVHSLGDD